MLDFDTALDLMNKYGYTSITVHPYIYQDGDTIGICYTYNDEEYGLLERIKIFNNAEEFEEFLKMFNWVQVNGKLNHVRMILDNYEAINPKIIFLRNEKIMVEGEMFDISSYDTREKMRVNMDPVSKVIYECGDLLLVYNEIKNRQLQYLKNINTLKNTLRKKYYDLQSEVDTYNKVKVERELRLIPDVNDNGINENLESSLKDMYNIYVVQKPTYEEAIEFLKAVWELCLGLELNARYYEAQKEETDIRNEMKIVDQKLTLMRTLNEDLKPLFGTDLVGRFRKINRECKAKSSVISTEYINAQMDAVNRKYSYFDKIDVLFTSDYLREAIQNSNYSDLAIKYAKGANYDVVSKYKTPINEVAANLSVQYRDKLSQIEQSILVLYNNEKYRKLCDAILNIPDFETQPIKKILKVLNTIKGFSKIKSECFDSVKRRIDDPVNQKVKASLFSNFDFTTFDSFVESLIKLLVTLKTVNEKMVLNGDINMYVNVRKVDELKDRLFVMTTNNLPALIEDARFNKSKVCITLLKEGMPVLYSPYCFDLGDIYGKNASPEMYIKEMINFELLIDVSDIEINIDPNEVNVAKYYSEPNIVENLYIVDDIKMSYKTSFCKCAFTSKLNTVVTMNQSTAVASNVSPVVNSVFDAGTLSSMAPPMDKIPEAPAQVNIPKEIELPKAESSMPIKKEEISNVLPKVNEVEKTEDKTKDSVAVQVKEEKANISKPVVADSKTVEQPVVQSVPVVNSTTAVKPSNGSQVVKKVVVKQVASGTNQDTVKQPNQNTTQNVVTNKVDTKSNVQDNTQKPVSTVNSSATTVKPSNEPQVVKKVVVKQVASSTNQAVNQNTAKAVSPSTTPTQGTNPATKVVVKQVVKPVGTNSVTTPVVKASSPTQPVNKQPAVVKTENKD